MNKLRLLLTGLNPWFGGFLMLAAAAGLQAQPLITSVVETGGDNEATDTILPKWTGITWNTTVANEPLLNTPVGTPYTVPVFGNNVPAFVDRAHAYVAADATLPIPDYLAGAEYIMSGNDNRDNASYQLDITVSDAAVVYLLIDNRYPNGKENSTPPNFAEGLDPALWSVALAWMGTEGFQPVANGLNRAGDPTWPDEIGIDEGADGTINQWYSIYSKTVQPGTFSVYQPDNAGRNMYGVALKRVPNSVNNPPEIKNLSPTNNALFYPPASGLSFTATTISPNSIPTANIKVSLNGSDVSGNLTIGGTGTSRTVSYSGLQPDTLYTARVIVTDQANRSTTNTFSFDTFAATSAIAIEAEDYNYDSGKFVSPATLNGYANLLGTRDIDFHNNNATGASTVYRVGDFVGQGTTTDVPRQAFTDAGATDYQLATIMAGDWWNYTRAVTDGSYRIYLRGSSAADQLIRLDGVGGDSTTANQTITSMGTFKVGPGTASFVYAPLSDASGNPVAVRLSGNTTLRLTALSAQANLQLNYLLLVPASGAASPAYLASATPTPGAVNVAPDATVRLAIANGSAAVNESSVALKFNNADVSSNITKTPTADGLLVTYDPPGMLALGSTQAVQVVFTQTGGSTVSNEWSFSVVPAMVTIPANYGTPVGSGQGSGFNFKIRKAPNTDAFGADRTLANTTDRANQQLADVLIDPDTLEPYVNEAPGPNNNGIGTTPLVNFEQDGVATGYFGGDTGFPYIDTTVMPGPNNIAMEFTTYVELTAGVHRFGVRSDDGFQLAAGPTVSQVDANLVLGQYEGGRGNGLPGGETTFEFNVETAGVYALRMIYYEGNGGANVELYSIDRDTLKRTLINDSATGAVKAFTGRATQIHLPTVSIQSPPEGALYPIAPTNVTVTATATVVNGSISLVEFFHSGTNKVGEAANSPYTIVWNNVPRGRYSLSAKATDTNGLTAVSLPVYIVVGQPLITNVVEIGGMNEPTDTVLPTWTGQIFSNGIAGEFLDPIRIPTFSEEAPAYVDRVHQWNGATPALPLPSYLVGGEYIMSGNDNRDALGYQLDIGVSQEALVYMLVDNRLGDTSNTDPPNFPDWTADRNGDAVPDMQWLLEQGWRPVTNGLNRTSNQAWPDEVGIDEAADGVGPGGGINQWSSVYVKRVPAGTVSIYASDNPGQNMYGVVITPITTITPRPVLNPPVLNGDTLTVTWTGGRLQEAAEANGPYTDVPGNPQGTYSVNVNNATRKFFRAVTQ